MSRSTADPPPGLNLDSRRAVEDYLDRLNRESPVARRQITGWGGAGGPDSLRLHAVPMPGRFAELGAFLGEARTTFALDIDAGGRVPASAPYSIGVVLQGAMHIRGLHGECSIRAGQGVIVDPAEIERTRLDAGTHLVEFALPKAPMLRLGAELAPGSHTGLPHFEPTLPQELTQRLLAMAREAARSLAGWDAEDPTDALFRRWLELISLTLLQQQPVHNAVPARLKNEMPPPAALRRALDFIEANAAGDILLADIADAAHVSVSNLGRLFVRHVGQSPAALLRDLRLDRVHEELRRGSDLSIRQLALRWGFQSPSQFSQSYRQRFGESPRDARRRG